MINHENHLYQTFSRFVLGMALGAVIYGSLSLAVEVLQRSVAPKFKVSECVILSELEPWEKGYIYRIRQIGKRNYLTEYEDTSNYDVLPKEITYLRKVFSFTELASNYNKVTCPGIL